MHRVQAGLTVPDMDRIHYFDFRAIFACLQNFYAEGVINVTYGKVLMCVQELFNQWLGQSTVNGKIQILVLKSHLQRAFGTDIAVK